MRVDCNPLSTPALARRRKTSCTAGVACGTERRAAIEARINTGGRAYDDTDVLVAKVHDGPGLPVGIKLGKSERGIGESNFDIFHGTILRMDFTWW